MRRVLVWQVGRRGDDRALRRTWRRTANAFEGVAIWRRRRCSALRRCERVMGLDANVYGVGTSMVSCR
jgi:hypothetical protein